MWSGRACSCPSTRLSPGRWPAVKSRPVGAEVELRDLACRQEAIVIRRALRRRCQHQGWLREALELPCDKAVGGKGHDAIVSQAHGLDPRLCRPLSKKYAAPPRSPWRRHSTRPPCRADGRAASPLSHRRRRCPGAPARPQHPISFSGSAAKTRGRVIVGQTTDRGASTGLCGAALDTGCELHMKIKLRRRSHPVPSRRSMAPKYYRSPYLTLRVLLRRLPSQTRSTQSA